MNELRWTDTNPAVEIDRVVISNPALLMVVGLVGLILLFAYFLARMIEGY